jgi:foldase protein PrsA
MTLDRELEKQGGKQVLENKISEMLIFNEASKQKVTVTQAEIDAKLKQIEDQVTAQGQKLDDLLAQQGQTRADLQSQIKIQILVEKMVGKDIQVTDKEISDYFNTNSSTYPKGTKLEEKQATIKTTLYQQKLSAAFQPWLDGIRKSASVRYFVQF